MPARRSTPARELSFSNPTKIYFPGSGTTKAEIIRYYIEVARWMLPHLRDRPITLIRFPEGVRGTSFYEKNAPGHTPEWVQRFEVPRRRHEGVINYILINDAETLAWCANLAAIEFHPFLHRVPHLDRPTHIAFDLDPGEGADLLTCIEVAFLLRDLFRGLDLQAWPKVSGSKGLQLYVPLNSEVSYAATQPFAKAVAELLAQQEPKLVVSNMTKSLRRGKVLIDWSQNSEAKTTVSVYSVRAKRDEPFVSMPVRWEELERAARQRKIESLYFSPAAALARLRKEDDLFAPVLTLTQELPAAFAGAAKSGRRSPAALTDYAAKRDFTRTAEPKPVRPTRSRQGSRRRFVIQKHAASHLHYDFRLEMEDTLKSWAVPKGLPYELDVKRSAFETEDHPLDYLEFEGTIPAGQYGGGTVMVWDIGTYDVIEGNYWKGSLLVHLAGQKLKGAWQLYRIRGDGEKNVWLVERREKPMRPVSAQADDRSVLSRRSMAQIAHDNDAQWQSNRVAPGENKTGASAAPAAPRAAAAGAKPGRAAAGKKSGPKKSARGKKPTAAPPAFVEPMVAEPVTALPEGADWLYEVKWDGYRTLARKDGDTVQLLSRRNKDMTADFPGVAEAVASLPVANALLDGEIVALDKDGHPSFQALQNRSADGAPTIVYYAFDVLHLEGESWIQRPLEERKAALAELVAGHDVLLSAELPGSAADVVEAVRRLGLEGVVAKRRDGIYEPGERSGAWRKLRLAREQEFVIGGYRPGTKGFESVLVGVYEGGKLQFVGKVRAGFNPRSRAALSRLIKPDRIEECPFANLPEERKGRWGEGVTRADMAELCWVKPRHVIQVGFVEWTRHGHLRHAAYKAVRDDKKPRDVVREV